MYINTVFVQVATNQVDPQSASYSAWGNIGKPEANLAKTKTDKTDCRASARPFHRSTSRTSSYPGQLMSTGQQPNKQRTILQDLSTKDSEQLNKSKSLTPQSPSSSRPNCWPNVLEGSEWGGKNPNKSAREQNHGENHLPASHCAPLNSLQLDSPNPKRSHTAASGEESSAASRLFVWSQAAGMAEGAGVAQGKHRFQGRLN